MTKHISKSAMIREAWAAGDRLGALRIASRFTDRSGDTKAIQRGWDAHSNPAFYHQIGKDPDALTDKALTVIKRKFIDKTAKASAAPAATEATKAKKLAKAKIEPARKLVDMNIVAEAEASSPAKVEKGVKPLGKRAAVQAAVERGELPAAPDFSAKSHARYRDKLAELVAMAEAGDIGGLRAVEIKTYSSSPKAMDNYRKLAIAALEARAVKNGRRAV